MREQTSLCHPNHGPAINGFSCPMYKRVLSRKDKLRTHCLKVHVYGKVPATQPIGTDEQQLAPLAGSLPPPEVKTEEYDEGDL